MTNVEPKRLRSYEWITPAFVGPPLKNRSGLQYFEALRDGAVPPQPIAATIGWSVIEVEAGMIRVRAAVGEHLFHGGGMVHGGVLATLLDSAMAGAVMSTLAKDSLCATLNLNVQFLANIRKPERLLTATGRLLQRTGKTAAAEGLVEDEQGNCLARATATILIRDS